MKRKIVIFGTGEQAMQWYYRLRTDYEVPFFLDNDKNKKTFRGISVEQPNEQNVRKHFIVVCSNAAHYVEISRQLKTYGLLELKDFCEGSVFGKKIIVLHGNCHMKILKEYMLTSELFRQEYAIYPLPAIQDIESGYIEDDILEYCDIFIHQDIRKDNYYGLRLSDDYILPRLGKHVKQITVPNLYNFGMAFFPQTTMNKHNPSYNNDANGLFRHGDENVEKLLEEGICDLDEILNKIQGEAYEESFICQEFERYKNAALEREMHWDVKIMNYILENYKTKRLFYDYGHPYNHVIKEICIGVFQLLHIDWKTIKEININLGIQEEPVYPCVMRALGLEWNDNNDLRKDGYKLIETQMDFAEYYREYLYWSYEL